MLISVDSKAFYRNLGFSWRSSSITPTCELRLVANVVKHGDGKSCEELRALAPRLFEGLNYYFDIFSKADGPELTPEDFRRYAKAAKDFWDTFPEKLTLAPAA
jgi:hypothetical protein